MKKTFVNTEQKFEENQNSKNIPNIIQGFIGNGDYNGLMNCWKNVLIGKWKTKDWGIITIKDNMTFTSDTENRYGSLALDLQFADKINIISKHTGDPNSYYLEMINKDKLEMLKNYNDDLSDTFTKIETDFEGSELTDY